MRDIRKRMPVNPDRWGQVHWREYEQSQIVNGNARAFHRLMTLIEDEVRRRCSMSKRTVNAFRNCSSQTVLFNLYLELKERFEEEEDE